MYQRRMVETLKSRMMELDNPIMQVLVGPRQTGKSTMISQALSTIDVPYHSVSADDEISPDVTWIQREWQQARNLQSVRQQPIILILDEIQKVDGWENAVKGLWDADRRQSTPLKVVLSGSSSLLLHRGLADSLMGSSTRWMISFSTAAIPARPVSFPMNRDGAPMFAIPSSSPR